MPRAAEAVARLRAARVPMAVVTNQSAIARGLVSVSQVEAVNRRVEQLLGPIGPWLVCPHEDRDGCDCRKPRAGLLRAALETLGCSASGSVMVGDTEADMGAARTPGCVACSSRTRSLGGKRCARPARSPPT